MLVSGGADWTVRCWDVKSAGGPSAKTRENGAAPNGTASTPVENGNIKEEEESIER